MDERMIEDDDDTSLRHHSSRPISHSQPLSTSTFISSAGSSKRNALRKHSLDENATIDSSLTNAAATITVVDGRSLSYPHALPPHGAGGCGGGAGPRFARHSVTGSLTESDSSLTLERVMSAYGGAPGSLPEFMGTGGGSGIFRVPIRAAMHPGRPPPLELRPHPLRETQVGVFLRTIACYRDRIWAGTECGLRVWNMEDVYACWPPGRGRRRDDESAPFRESERSPPALCLAVDAAAGLVWSGHKDGKIRSWNMEQTRPSSGVGGEDGDALFKEGLSWQAHRGPVFAIVMTSYGDLWSSSEVGVIKVWPWESIEKALSLTEEKRHMATISVERSFVDLRSQVTVNGVCSLPATDVKHLLSDNTRSKVWSASSASFALWDSRKKELLKVFGIDGQAETRFEATSVQEMDVEDDMKGKFVSTSRKEKSQGSTSFFQRSRNALMGAADAVRRVAAKGTFSEDNKRTEALAIAMDGTIWTGCTNGLLIQWDGNGNRLQDFQYLFSSVHCLCAFGTRMWVGYASGTVMVIDLDGTLIGSWVAHSNPVIKMAVGDSYIFTLANHGGIRGWNLMSPGPLDNILKRELATKEMSWTKFENLKILVGTWNVGQERASPDSLISWLGSAASEVGLVVVGLQEVEMGAGFLAMAAAKETVGLEGSANGHWWLDNVGKMLDEGSSFERVGSRQLAGLLVAAWARKNIRPNIGDVDAAAVPLGFGHAIGNKGAVGLRMRVFDRTLCFVNCHFAAHLEAVNRRNADFDHVYRTLSFTRPSSGLPSAQAGSTSAVAANRAASAVAVQSDDGKPELSDADMVVFLGDFNYRLYGITYDEARDFVSQRCFDWLREKDQLRAEMKAGKVFQGLREGHIRFPPTYKFERHQSGLAGYDSGEKKRIPAWCDRILYRDSRSISVAECSLECPVVSSISQYDACMDVTDSDHKPVKCIFNVEIARVDERIRRQLYGEIIMSNENVRSMLEEYNVVPETVVSTNNIILENQDASILRITNKCDKHRAMFEITCQGQSTIKEDGLSSELSPRGSFGFPHWLEVHPAAGIINPGQIMEVSVHHEDFYTQEEYLDGIPQNWWCEDNRDKEVVLRVNIHGNGSTDMRSHHINVTHCFSAKTSSNDARTSSQRHQSNLLHRSDFANLGNSSDVVQDLCHLR